MELAGGLGQLGDSLTAPAFTGKRQRDIYHLPFGKGRRLNEVFHGGCAVIGDAIIFVNAVIIVLNYTYGVRAPMRLPRFEAMTITQRDVIVTTTHKQLQVTPEAPYHSKAKPRGRK